MEPSQVTKKQKAEAKKLLEGIQPYLSKVLFETKFFEPFAIALHENGKKPLFPQLLTVAKQPLFQL